MKITEKEFSNFLLEELELCGNSIDRYQDMLDLCIRREGEYKAFIRMWGLEKAFKQYMARGGHSGNSNAH